MTRFTLIVILAILLLTSAVSFGASYSGGAGTADNPYQIGTASDWQMLMATPGDWGKPFTLIADVDLAGVTVTPVGDYNTAFSGIFDGDGHSIRQAAIHSTSDHVGLFGNIGNGGAISNLSIEDVNIVGKRYIGGLAGYISKGSISNCSSTGRAAANSLAYVGGLVGFNSGSTISNCSSSVDISGGGSTLGGLVAVNSLGGSIFKCRASGQITDVDANNFGSCAGGLTGLNTAQISNSCATGEINVNSLWPEAAVNIGALTGLNGYGGTIRNSFASGKVLIGPAAAATVCGGGLVGVNSPGDVNDCYAQGQIAFDCAAGSSYFFGGLVGINNEGAVNRCYSKGAINAGESAEADHYVGGFCGLNMDGIVWASFWDRQTSTKTASGGGKGLTTAQMKTALIYQNAGWSDKGWVINNGTDYPRQEWENAGGAPISAPDIVPLFGSGIAADPYQVRTAADFAYLSWHRSILDKHIVLLADIDLAGIEVYPIGDLGVFTGTFDGTGHVIKNLTINEPTNSYIGVFSRVGAGALITRVGIEDANIIGWDYVGGLIGKNEGGAVRNCYFTGSVAGLSYVGGLIGSNGSGTAATSYSAAAIIGLDPNSFDYYAGGLVGYNGSGSDKITACFWDIETSDCNTSAGGTGKTTAEMQTLSTFTNAGWDFVGETANGTDDIWDIREGTEYPRLVRLNTAPVADGGEDRTAYAWIDGKAKVTLDGSDSNDLDGDALTYKWTWTIGAETFEANGISPTIELPVGVHTIWLVVNDGTFDSAPDDFNITVVATVKGGLNMMPCVINRASNQPHVLANLWLPNGIRRGDIDGNEPLMLSPGNIEASRKWIVPCLWQGQRSLTILAFFDKDELMAAVPQNGSKKLTVVGKLTSGQYFYGCDSVMIMGKKSNRPWWMFD